MISTRDLSRLPDVDSLKRLLQSMAMLDAILEPEWQFRYYSFNAAWADGEQMGSMRNGEGDEFFALFSAAGCWLKGFAHEAPMAPQSSGLKAVWPGVLETVPAEFTDCLREPAFCAEHTTFCIWRRYIDSAWLRGPVKFPRGHADPDGSEDLLSRLDGRPETYREWAAEYFSKPELAIEPVRLVYEPRPLTANLIKQLNPGLSLEDLEEDIRQIGYPSLGR